MFVAARRAGAVFALAAALAVSGCSGSGSKPVSLPSISPSATSTSPSPTSTAAQLAAVTAVVKRYFALVGGPTSTAAADQLQAIMTTSCSCQRVARSMRDAATKGEHYFGRATITSSVPSLDGVRTADVLIRYNYTRSGLLDAHGRVLHADAARQNVSLDFRMLSTGSVWLIDDVQIVSNGSAA